MAKNERKGTALITGASAGLGVEFAKLFARDGYPVILVARRRDKLEQLARELSSNVAVHVIPMDLSVEGSIGHLIERVRELGVTVDFLVNNAGFGSNGSFAELPAEKELEMIDLNIRSLVELTQAILPGMIERKHGRILNLGSMAGFLPGPYMATYYATKAFVNSFSEALAQELKGTGVTCTVLAPGPTATEFGDVSGMKETKAFRPIMIATAAGVAESGYRAMMRGQALRVPGAINSISVQSLRFFPRAMVRKVMARMNRA